MIPSDEEGSFFTLLRNGNFLRFFLAQAVSSLGDWVGVIAIAILAQDIKGETGVGIVLMARVIPGFFVGPIAGVLVDRWDRKRIMVLADVFRALIIFSLPFFPNLIYLIVASMVLESLTLVWGPAKDASLPHFVKPSQLAHANSLSLIAIYAPWPLASVVYYSLSTLGGFLGRTVPALEGLTNNEVALALWMDSLTFGFSAAMVATLLIPMSTRRAERLNMRAARDDLVEGLTFVLQHRQVRPWLIGIALTFTAAGAVFSLGIGFVKTVLGGSENGFAFLVGFLGSGMIVGLLSVGLLAKRIHKDVLFSSSLLLLGAGLVTLASMNSLDTGIPVASALGFFGGVAYSTGYSLVHEQTSDELRGRTFSAAYTVIRIGTLIGLGLFPLIAGAIAPFTEDFNVPGTRATLWLAGLVAVGGGVLSMRAIRARTGETAVAGAYDRGLLVVFEGGEGAGKSTQMAALAQWLQARGEDVVLTREPGGTQIGAQIREILLSPATEGMDARTEALLYAADRAQHVAEVIRPAMHRHRIVLSDRFVDSSLAYQGLARGLGLDEIYRISEWATGGLMPDLVFFLRLDPRTGLRRIDQPDRIEQEDVSFHERVSEAYMQLARRFPSRFVVLDADRPAAELHQSVVRAFEEKRLAGVVHLTEAGRRVGKPGPIAR